MIAQLRTNNSFDITERLTLSSNFHLQQLELSMKNSGIGGGDVLLQTTSLLLFLLLLLLSSSSFLLLLSSQSNSGWR
ncbi:putative E3 ubiquitin-protein ligase [Trichinella pseudospiralis]